MKVRKSHNPWQHLIGAHSSQLTIFWLLLALISYLSERKNWSYCGFLNLNQDTIIASLISLTNNSSLSLAKWQSFDAAWYNRFLDEAKELLEPNTFATLKKKVCFFLFCKVRVTPNTPRGHLVRITGFISLVATPVL